MPKYPLDTYIMCIKNGPNEFTQTTHIVRARTPLAAAKKFYRSHKILLHIFVMDENKLIYEFETKHFFTKKKEHQLKR